MKVTENVPPVSLAKLSSIMRSNMVRARTNVSFIDTKSAGKRKSQKNYGYKEHFFRRGAAPLFWLYLSINFTILGRRVIQDR